MSAEGTRRARGAKTPHQPYITVGNVVDGITQFLRGADLSDNQEGQAAPLRAEEVRGLLLESGAGATVDQDTLRLVLKKTTAVASEHVDIALRTVWHKLTAKTTASRATRKTDSVQDAVEPPASVTMEEVVWLLSNTSSARDSGATGNCASGATKRRRTETPADSAAAMEGSALLRELEQRWGGNAAEFEKLRQSLATPLPMALRLHHGDSTLRYITEAYALPQLQAAGLNPSSIFQKATASDPTTSPTTHPSSAAARTVCEAYQMSDAAYHAEENSSLQLACRNGHSAGMWSFQELVSMVPVVALGVGPHHRVLDMCAAPGSKTLQCLDAMAAVCGAGGVVVANEKDRIKARQTLPSRMKRHHSPHAVVTRCDATSFPNLLTTPATEPVLFDRIVCDVPCSGDGTARKDTGVWAGWSPAYGAALVPTQRSLLLRAVDLLEVGGIVAYSTCSLNPAEDEAVVARCLDCYGDGVELLDVNAVLRASGVDLQSAGGTSVPFTPAKRQHEEPPETTTKRQEAHGRIAQRVLRVFPHNDDTGGFFVALLRRVQRVEAPLASSVLSQKLNNWTNAKRFQPIDVSPEAAADWTSVLRFYDISNSDSSHPLLGGLTPAWSVTPNGSRKRALLMTPSAYSIVFDSKPRKGPGVELISAGMRGFERLDERYLQESGCRYRMAGEAAARLGPLCGPRRRITLTVEQARQVLLDGFLTQPHLTCPPHLVDPATGHPMVGPVVLRFAAPPSTSTASSLVGIEEKEEEKKEWIWLSGVLTGSKLDLTVDASIRRAICKFVFNLDIAMPTAGEPKNEDDDGDGAEQELVPA